MLFNPLIQQCHRVFQ